MIVLNIDTLNDNPESIEKLINDGKHLFVMIYMDGCGHCETTKPEWNKIDSTLGEQYSDNDDIVVASINKETLPNIPPIQNINGFPTIRYIGDQGNISEDFEDSSITDKSRSIDSFVNWIESKTIPVVASPPISQSKLTTRKQLQPQYKSFLSKRLESLNNSATIPRQTKVKKTKTKKTGTKENKTKTKTKKTGTKVKKTKTKTKKTGTKATKIKTKAKKTKKRTKSKK